MKCFLSSSAFFLLNQDSLKLIFNAMRYPSSVTEQIAQEDALCSVSCAKSRANFFMDDPRFFSLEIWEVSLICSSVAGALAAPRGFSASAPQASASGRFAFPSGRAPTLSALVKCFPDG